MTDTLHGFDQFSLQDRVFIVTGASSGIGLAIAHGFAAVGATVGLNSRSRDRLEAAAKTVPGSFILPFDAADLEATTNAVEETLEKHGRLDGVVCNAGVRDRRPADEIVPEDFRALLETNLVGPYHLARLAAKHMKARGGDTPGNNGESGGRIIFISSIAARQSRPGDPVYGGTKGGIDGLMRGLAVDLGPYGITVNAIAPGPIATETNMPLVNDPEVSREFTRQVPLGRWGTPDEVAGAAIFLASEAGRFVTGHVLTVDGGATVKIYG